jgi:flagellar biosynthesis/type III secretory pathway chaperone
LKTMQDLVAGLVGLLEEQEALIRRLIELGREETRALRKEDLARLSVLVAEQERSSQELGRLEARRWALQQEISRRLGRSASEVSLQELAEQAGPGGRELEQVVVRLRRSSEELRELNRINRTLVHQALAYINRVLGALGSQAARYDGEGQFVAEGERSRVNTVV